jgi:hypothetical protein
MTRVGDGCHCQAIIGGRRKYGARAGGFEMANTSYKKGLVNPLRVLLVVVFLSHAVSLKDALNEDIGRHEHGKVSVLNYIQILLVPNTRLT